jgi:hypothetical protein
MISSAFRWSPQSFQEPQQQNSSDSTGLKWYRNCGSSTTCPPVPIPYVVLDIARQAMIALGVRAMPPSRGLLETNSFWAIDCRGVSGYAHRFIAVRESFGTANGLKNCSFLGRGSYTPRKRIHCSATPILHVSQWMAWSCSAPAQAGLGYSADL